MDFTVLAAQGRCSVPYIFELTSRLLYRGRLYGVLVEGPEHSNLLEGVPPPGKRHTFNPAIIPEVDEFDLVYQLFSSFFLLLSRLFFFLALNTADSRYKCIVYSAFFHIFWFTASFSLNKSVAEMLLNFGTFEGSYSQSSSGSNIAIPDNQTTKTCPSLGKSITLPTPQACLLQVLLASMTTIQSSPKLSRSCSPQ